MNVAESRRFSECWCSKTLAKTCEIHGPGPRKGPHWYDRKTSLPTTSGPLPTAGQRWGQVLREASKPRDPQDVARELKTRKLDPWTRQLAKALNVDLEGA